MHKKTILVTGASGYLGPHIIQTLANNGHRVIAVGDQAQVAHPSVLYVNEDIRDIDAGKFPDGKIPDACLHLAWRNGFTHNADTHLEDLATHHAFLVRMAKLGIHQFCVLGSVHEIGYFNGMVDETTPTNPRSLYGIAKNALRASLQVSLPEHQATLQWLRLFYIVGDPERGQSVFSKLLRMDRQGVTSVPFTTGRNKFDFIEIEDLSDQICAVVSQDKVNGIIHCCSGTPVTIREKIDEFIAKNNLAIRPDYGTLPDRDYDSPAIWGSRSKIDAILQNTSDSN